MGLRTFITGRTSLVLLFPSLWAAYPAVTGFDFIMVASLLLSHCGSSFVFGYGVSFFGGFQHPPVGGCSTTTCSFGVLTKGDEHMAFYSASLYLDFKFHHPYKRRHILQHYSNLACNFQNRWIYGEFPGSPVARTQEISLQWAQVQSLVGELRSHKSCGIAKKRDLINKWKCVIYKTKTWTLIFSEKNNLKNIRENSQFV